ncbi:MarR family winged helix-turn-helix transcriptional regulator [Streptomyces sp. NPDC007088]|uniref:MarR family winged helix-turn-helix transcriptional regulator n=1 Tax=Streptomyces sp. NPDC007088 TaxID=3364773 RepID=UPI0036D1F1BD
MGRLSGMATRTRRAGSDSASASPPASGARERPAADRLSLDVVQLIGAVVGRYHEEYELAASRHALTGAQAKVLGLLSLEPMPMRRIARKLKCEPSNVTGIIDRLEARGLVERRPDPDDRRVKLAAPTEQGRQTARQLRDGLDFAREPLAGLSRAERLTLRDLLIRVVGEEEAREVTSSPEHDPAPATAGAVGAQPATVPAPGRHD